MDTKQLRTTAYHPPTDGLVERFNGTLVQSLSMYVSSDERDLDEHLQNVLFAYCISPSEVTGESPFYLLHVNNNIWHLHSLSIDESHGYQLRKSGTSCEKCNYKAFRLGIEPLELHFSQLVRLGSYNVYLNNTRIS